ncbi:MAG TPA: gephyrin-like molybdotransferase Glp [Anaerolineaceae bacterium]
MAGLLSVKEAQERILTSFQPVGVEFVALQACAGRILAEELLAPDDLPLFDNSSMDGFAVRASDVSGAAQAQPVALKIVADIPAGTMTDIVLQPGQAARIMTGAPIPAGADAVVPVEDTSFSPALSRNQAVESGSASVSIFRATRSGAHVRRRGDDIHAGQVLLRQGRFLLPQDVGVLASAGRTGAHVYRKPRIALFSSGDELVQPGLPLGSGQIYDSNQYVLAALLEQEGAEVIRLGTTPDDPQQIETRLNQAVEQHVDAIVTSAGVSVGAFDYVRQVIEAHGQLDFWKVNMRPGKPLAFGSFSGIPLIGLPGNPVSAFVGCLVFVLPVVYRLSGRQQALPRRETVLLGEPIESDGRESYLRVLVQLENGRRVARLTGHQGSGNLYSLVQANALLIVPSGVKSLPSDSEVEIWFFDRS